jgi:hypothetical protein
MTWIAEIGAVAVGLGGLAFGWTQSRQTIGQQRTLADLAATRDVLEASAVHLHRIAYVLNDVKLDLPRNARAAGATLAGLGKSYDELSERVKVRLGPDHEATREFVAAGSAALNMWRAIDRAVVLHLPHLEDE